MSEKMYRPKECVNANCVAMCTPFDYEFCKGFFDGNAKNCPKYERGYNETNARIKAELEEIKAEMEDKLEPFILGERNLKKDALQILDKYIKELKGEQNK